MEEYLKQNTECVICFKVFKEPRILPCLHTFCLHCLETMKKDNNITCPVCTATSPFEARKIDFKANELVEVRLKQQSADEGAVPKRRTQKQILNQHREELLVLIDEFKGLKEDVKSQVDGIATARKLLIADSTKKRVACIAHINGKFNEVDTKITQTCDHQSERLTKTQKELKQNLEIVETQLIQTDKELESASNEFATGEYRQELHGRLAALPALTRATKLDMDLHVNKEWQTIDPVAFNTNQVLDQSVKAEDKAADQTAGSSASNVSEGNATVPRAERSTSPCPRQIIAFSAYMKGLTTVEKDTPMKFDGIMSNVGAHYDAATGRFTCPRNGHYVFSLNLMSERHFNQAYGKIIKEGELVAYALASNTNKEGHYSHAAAYVIVECKAGEKVWVQGHLLKSKVYGERFSTFSGHLLVGY